MVDIQLTDEEKIQVLLLALGLFLSALTLSVCLAATFCPLNKWLLNRSAKKRQRKLQLQQQQHQYHYSINQCSHSNRSSPASRHNYFNNNNNNNSKIHLPIGQSNGRYFHLNQRLCYQPASYKGSSLASSYIGPPPAYEAALRAKRLQSLTGSLYSNNNQDFNSSKDRHNTDNTCNNNQTVDDWPASIEEVSSANKQVDSLDFGDYFHQPKEAIEVNNYDLIDEFRQQQRQNEQKILLASGGPVRAAAAAAEKLARKHPPVMLRLWVKVLEPNELVLRARGNNNNGDNEKQNNEQSHQSLSSSACSTIRRLSLNRQLSIPHLFGSLVSTLSNNQSINDNKQASTPREEEHQINEPQALGGVKIHRSSSSSSSLSCSEQIIKNSNCETGDKQIRLELPIEKRPDFSGSDCFVVSVPPTSGDEKSELKSSNHSSATNNFARKFSPATGLLDTASSITSRVLHMNVSSFSYVKDETLISTKKHNQMNFQHFFNSTNRRQLLDNKNNNNNDKSGSGSSKSCQLVISICDIENVLNSSWLNEKSCALLSNNSAIYVQCEILLPKSKSARLLGPLTKALPGNNYSSHYNDNAASKRHTVNFESVISASALECRLPPPAPPSTPQAAGAHNNWGAQEGSCSPAPAVQEDSCSPSLSTTTPTSANNGQSTTSVNKINKPNLSTNWRHEPNADGRSIVVFSSVPKEIAHQQQLTASVASQINSSQNRLPPSDLIQFDSVFVSPILNRSTIENGYIRFRIYSQCKYVNETCLAELKLPLKQLLQSETSDNLSDVSSNITNNNNNNNDDDSNNNSYLAPQKQADLILNNLLTNLVTASTGSPLSTLIEQISTEEREAEEQEQHNNNETDFSKANNTFKSMLQFSWSSNNNNNNNQLDNYNNKGLKGSCSFNDSLYKLTTTNDNKQSSVEETERRIEENYYRSLMVSHWLNYLVAPSYECQLVDEPKGKIIIGLSYLPTSNRVIFNAHRASIDDDSYANSKHVMKNLRLQAGTCYLLRFLMIANGRLIKRKQTPVAKKPEWDSQEPITFDLVSISVEQPSFIVALVMRNTSGAMSTGSLQNLRGTSRQQVCNCGLSNHHHRNQASSNQDRQRYDVQSEPESLQHFGATYRASAIVDGIHQQQHHNNSSKRHNNLERDLVIGHLVLSDEIWREMRAEPRKQIVKQFKMY